MFSCLFVFFIFIPVCKTAWILSLKNHTSEKKKQQNTCSVLKISLKTNQLEEGWLVVLVFYGLQQILGHFRRGQLP